MLLMTILVTAGVSPTGKWQFEGQLSLKTEDFLKFHSVHALSLFRPSSTARNTFWLFTTQLLVVHLLIKDTPLISYEVRMARKEEKTRHAVGFKPTTSRVSAPEVWALPLCYNRCQVRRWLTSSKVRENRGPVVEGSNPDAGKSFSVEISEPCLNCRSTSM